MPKILFLFFFVALTLGATRAAWADHGIHTSRGTALNSHFDHFGFGIFDKKPFSDRFNHFGAHFDHFFGKPLLGDFGHEQRPKFFLEDFRDKGRADKRVTDLILIKGADKDIKKEILVLDFEDIKRRPFFDPFLIELTNPFANAFDEFGFFRADIVIKNGNLRERFMPADEPEVFIVDGK